MKRTHIPILLTAWAFLVIVPVARAATPPPNVTGITTGIENGKISVRWNPPADAAAVSFYRIYFSSTSILENNGDYDDFERTQGTETSIVFAAPPLQSEQIFFSVLAVSADGTESAAFLEEANLTVPPELRTSRQASSAPSHSAGPAPSSAASAPPPSSSLTIERAAALTSTGVALDFSAPLLPTQQINPAVIVIVDASGVVLPVSGITIDGNHLILTTASQQGGRIYALAIPVPILPADAHLLPSQPTQLSFTGVSGGSALPRYIRNPHLPPIAEQRDVTPPEDPAGLDLTPSRSDSHYTVRADWLPSLNTTSDLDSYTLYSKLNGAAFSPATGVESDQHAATFTGVPPGTFSVRVTAVDASGNESAGIERAINLPASGLGLMGAFLVAGAIAGRRVRSKESCR